MNITKEKTLESSISRLEVQTQELQQLYAEVEAELKPSNPAPPTSASALPSWISITVIAAVAAGLGLFAGVALSGGLS